MKPEILGNIKFGPYVALMKVHQPLIDGLLKRAEKKEVGSGNSELASLMSDQRGYSLEDKRWFVNEFQPYIDSYVEGNCQFLNTTYSEPHWSKSFNLLSLWINYMKENEYNPTHTHSGMLSWVMYLKTHDIEKERKEYTGRSAGPGATIFHYGEHSFPQWATHTQSYLPQEGYVWIFPALLRHEVIPFKTPGTRITVSGNLYFKHPSQKSDAEPTPMDSDFKRMPDMERQPLEPTKKLDDTI
jgi:uncharacterized protein (TIGR02466 family)